MGHGVLVAGVIVELLRELQMQTDRESLGYKSLSSVSLQVWEVIELVVRHGNRQQL